ncbi:Crp/Fnr family transcriptional regulator [Bosea sp. RCC_152_1]|uniref:Crp/Fnr family transcriptional regulator n=1 Tax=Bosea sp. RCC_152_1 TaxID=3239228 RepID=UPI0035256457
MISPTTTEMLDNELLAKLNEDDRRRLAVHMMMFELAPQHILQPAGEEVVDTWFPCGSSLASFQLLSEDGSGAVEVALVGREGAIGGIVSNGSLPAYANAIVRIGGPFFRIKTAALEQAKLESITLRHWFARYSDCLIAQVFQTSACNATHTIMQRSAKWLLAAMARTRNPRVNTTQEQLAETLGVGRTFVTRIVHQLRNEGIIFTNRGAITVLNKSALKEKACRCTDLIENHYDIVLHGIYHDG